MVLATLTSIHFTFNHSMSPNARCCINGFLNFFFTHLSALSYQGSTPSPKVFSKENSTDDKSFSERNTFHLIVCETKLILKFLCHLLIPFLYMVQSMYNRIHLLVIIARHNLILKKLFRFYYNIKKDPCKGVLIHLGMMLFIRHYHEVILLLGTRSSHVVGQQMTSMLSYLRLKECSLYRKFQTLELLLLLSPEIQSRML